MSKRAYANEYSRSRNAADLLTDQAADYAVDNPAIGSALAAVAQAHATLALAAATMAAAERQGE